MRLAEFILGNVEPILAEWETFARDLWPPGAAAGVEELRDHAADILRATATDMASAQTDAQQADKSRGGDGAGGAASARMDRASELHGAGRVRSGLDLMAVVSEYRALRATVIRLWRDGCPSPDRRDLEDLTRFNESIDQSLTEALRTYTVAVDRSRQTFLAILGHDLRNPLNAITMSADLLARAPGADAAQLVGGITRGARAMARMVADLLDFGAAGLGAAMPVTPAPLDLRPLGQELADETRAAHPGRTVRYQAHGDLTGEWDAGRLRQLLSNLLGNAAHHGAADGPVDLTISAEKGDGGDRVEGGDGAEGGVVLAVHNAGPPIPPDALPTIFDPLTRDASDEGQRRRRPGSIGLGLYIAREIATAHGGTVDVASSAEAGTTFTVRLPRRRAKPAS
jgi:hypothetical protein